MAELIGAPLPPARVDKFMSVADDEKAVAELGIEVASSLCSELLNAGAPGIHFITMNKAASIAAIAKNVGLR